MADEPRTPEDEEALMAQWAAMAGGEDGGEAEGGTQDGESMAAEWEAMRAARAAMPSWMARAVSEVDFV